MSDDKFLVHRLEGKVAIVTGASRGIGLGIAHRLVDEGARVCITARHAEPLHEAAAEFPAATAIAVAGKADDPEHRKEVMDTVFREFGHLDILVNNAGINPVMGPLMELEHGAARKIIEVNVIGTLGWTQDAYHHEGLGFSSGGTVINISSVAGQSASHGLGIYGVSKAAIDQLTRTLAVEMGPNVRVNAIAPAVIRTQFAQKLIENREEDITSHYPLGRLGVVEDAAALAAFLASADSEWITGQVITLDGGLLVAGGAA
jgi:NAD(P)-dependent dehydrogenase (short-subunit alcohol dehydrogenase family)